MTFLTKSNKSNRRGVQLKQEFDGGLAVMEGPKRRRTGCTECRRKKSKCDEKKPVCSRCLKYPRLCCYELNVKTTAFKTPTPLSRQTPPPPNLPVSKPCQLATHEWMLSPPQSPGSVLHDYRMTPFPMVQSHKYRFYFHHFIAHTASIYFPLQPDSLLSFAIPVAESSPPMLTAILAASCSHHYRLKGNIHSKTSAMEATGQCLSSLRAAIMTRHSGGESATLLVTSLMLATTSLCAGDTSTYRKHLNGAINIVRRDGKRHSTDALWALGLKWLAQLVLMNRISGLPLPVQQRKGHLDWIQLLESMPGPGHIDTITGLSLDLATILNQVCDLSDSNSPKVTELENASQTESDEEKKQILQANILKAQSLETLLLYIRSQTSSPEPTEFSTELDCTHKLFINATLLSLYRRFYGLPKSHEKVQSAVESILELLQKIDLHSKVNVPLLWPLLTAGCEAMTEAQRSIIATRMIAMESHGLGNCKIVYGFMTDYWERGNDTQWETFAKQMGVDLVLF
ncbi:C6 zinc finger domain containing protein [Colletotrichum truncatum]|uniref:C6 zinc finger domain containing protein n=1 Tax=Colletotrichum truncatum TaxID=5467 RepID=A0ACC3Z778_COLTU|nr:C6 zinc finger domain containing protein [Colletotrichum truncatum]KAF6785316.1 C6 zinc finger domain containing protein [Colletotrichum truncatum]